MLAVALEREAAKDNRLNGSASIPTAVSTCFNAKQEITMKLSRRQILRSSLTAAPTLLLAKSKTGHTHAEIDERLKGGKALNGLTKADLTTPCLLLDLDLLEANIAKMAAHARTAKINLRPHGKTHKCPEVAKALVKAGALGACAAKLSEAEVFMRAGVPNVLVTTAVIGKRKIERAVALAARHKDTIYCVDNAQNVKDLNDAAGAAKVKLNLAIDLNVGGRTGISCGEPAVALGKQIHSLPNVTLAALQAYAGQASHTTGFEQRVKVSRDAMTPAVETRRALEKAGVPVPILTGGSTGTYNIDSEMDGITELQPGSFVFMDIDYNRIGGKSGAVYQDFKNSLTVLATVVSKPADNYAIVDGGLKAFSTDKPFRPEVRGIDGLTYAFAGDEHGKIDLTKASRAINVGDRMEFVIPHCDPSVNLYDRIFCVRGGKVEAAWRVAARGMSQ